MPLLVAFITAGAAASAAGPALASANPHRGGVLVSHGHARSRPHGAPQPGADCPAVGRAGLPLEPMAVARRQAEAMAARMTLSQDLTLMHGVAQTPDGTVGATAAIPSLGIPAVNQQDGPAGVGDGVGGVTQLPAPVDLAASWDPGLAGCYGKVIGTEERGKGVEEVYGPTINIVRVPQWGRAFEALGEDPYLDGQVAAAEVNGIQGQGEMAEVKHFAVYNQETNRNTASDDSIVSQRAIQEIYSPAWAQVIDQSDPAAIMCAYSTVNGQYACQNPDLLTNELDHQLGYQGYVGSDYGATHSTVAAVNSGLDQEQPETTYFGDALQQAVQDGQVSQSTINDAVVRILTQMYRFRLFTDYPTGNINATVTNAADQQAGLGIAEAGTTLLKNASVGGSPVLPYASSTPSIAVIGADASTSPMTDGGGSAGVVPSSVVTPLQGIQGEAGTGTTISYSDGSDITAAASAASSAQEAVVFVNDVESEGVDRSSLELPGNSDQLIEAVAAANPRTVVVLNSGAPVLMPWLSQVAGVVEAWYPGQDDGAAIARVLFGQVNPSGHLPVTFPASASQTPVSTPQQFPGVGGQVDYSEGVDVGYRWYDQNNVTPLFPFGYGLSYTTFRYSDLHVTPSFTRATGQQGPLASVTATVTNTGSVAGADVAQLYVGQPSAAGEPPRQLQGFQRVYLAPGQSQRVHFTLDARSLSYWNDAANGYVVADGTFPVYVGDSSALSDLPLQGSLTVSASAGPQSVSISPGATLNSGNNIIPVTFTNNSDVTDHGVRLGLSVSTGGAPAPAADAARQLSIRGPGGGFPVVGVGTVAPGASVTVKFQAGVPGDAQPGSYQFSGTADYLADGSPLTTTNTARTAIAFGSVQAAFNGVGVAPSTNVGAGNFDGGGFSFEAEQLSADGFGPGDQVAAEGQALTLPKVAAGAPDEMSAEGQVISLKAAGSELGFLGAGTFGTQSGPVTINYTDGTTQTDTLSLADWYANAPATGSVIAASGPWNVPPSQTSSFGAHTVAVYYTQIPVNPAKTIASVTLPDNPLLHLFDIGVPSAASYPSVAAAYDDTGLAPAASPLDGNYDGGGYSYDSDALPAAGLSPGATVTAQGVSFTWPSAGGFDNLRAEGQTIALGGAAGSVLGFLGAGGFGTQSGPVTITYTDGTTQTATLSMADWYADSAVPGGTVVATVPWNQAPGTTLGPHQVSVYSATVPLAAGKTVASVTLPTNFNLHVFAMAVGG
ncbi:MAG TPA: glycoside hydrolase family 3 C-terminal domain-containing protein [Streptosporangiaceae bacterium]|nr:glycoside hydrolase family 3 C-terminal domain-containing protein [Streptosporangiaceae bacterium]